MRIAPNEKCSLCPTSIHRTRTQPVPGDGPIPCSVMFIGEAPGYNEDKLGRPFVGRAGQMFDSLLYHAGLTRDNVYVTNVVKCRPTENGRNRQPTLEEVMVCSEFLAAEIVQVEPKVICPMGNVATQHFAIQAAISRVHGQVFERTYCLYDVKLIPLYHPAVAMYNKAMFPTLLADMKTVKQELDTQV